MRRLFVPAVSSLAMLAVLLALGVWQLQRNNWKAGLLAQIAAAERAPATDLTSAPAPFAKVRLIGTLRTEQAVLYGAEGRDVGGRPTMGAQLLAPLERAGARPVWVVLGWVPSLGTPDLATPGQASTVIEGFVRPPDRPGPFSPQDDPRARRFYTLNAQSIAASLDLATPEPYTLVALGPPGVPDPARRLPRPPNDHLTYAATWFGLAATLAGVFLVYARKVLKP